MAKEMKLTTNYKKHYSSNPLQSWLLDRFYQTLTGLTHTLKIESVLDAGCAEGFGLNNIRKNRSVKRLAGLDRSVESIALGKKLHPFIKFTKGDIYQMKYQTNQFDLVICTEVLEHLTNPERALKELIRVSKKYYLLAVPNEPWFRLANLLRGKNISRWGNDIEHIQHWSKKQFIDLISQAGLKIMMVKTPFPWTMVLACSS